MWLVNAHVVDVLAGEVLPSRAIEIAPDGTIAQVAAAVPPGLPDDEITDVAGRWLLPGLISCHTHLSVVFPFSDTDEAENPALTAYRSAARATAALTAGITTIRCVHEQNRADLLLRTAARRGWITAPRILGAGRAVSARGGHGQGSACAYATGEDEFYAAALAELAAGADHVKIFINGGLASAGERVEKPEMTDAEIRGSVRAAAEHDTYVVAHSGESAAIRQALAQGVRCFEHAYRLDDATAALLAARGAYLTPTLCVTRSAAWMRANGFAEHTIANAANAADEHLASIRRAIRAGITLLNGTDYPPGDLVDGVPVAVHELFLMAEAGLTPLQALQSVSVNGARLLGIDGHVGQVRPGYAADLIAVPANPLEDLTALRGISLVMQAGRVIRDSPAAGAPACSPAAAGTRSGAVTDPQAAPPGTPARNAADGTRRYLDASGWQEQAGYSRAVRRGSVITVSGTTATGPDGTALCPGDTLGQARICLERVLGAVAALGGQPGDVIRTVVYLAPGASWEDAARAHREALGDVAPANTMLYVAGLIGEGFEVEVEAMAVTQA